VRNINHKHHSLLKASLLGVMIALAPLPLRAEADDFVPIGIFLDLNRRDFRREPIEQWTRMVLALQSLGFNTAVVKADEAMLARAELLDFRLITGASWNNPERTARWERYASLLAWLGEDEPGRNNRLEEARVLYSDFRREARRPLAVALYLPSAYPHANDLADVILPDPYIFGHMRSDGSTYPITEIADRIAALRNVLAEDKRMWAVPQLYAWHPLFKRPPSPLELEVQTLFCLGEGAEGILYFALNSGQYYPHPPSFEPATDDEQPSEWQLYQHPDLVAAVKRVNRITRHILLQYGGRAEREDLEGRGIRYSWRRSGHTFSAEIRLEPELGVKYNF
jgi:hypothetical protein